MISFKLTDRDLDRTIEREMSRANNLMKEANIEIKIALRSKNVENIGVAQAMMESAQTKLNELQEMQKEQTVSRTLVSVRLHCRKSDSFKSKTRVILRRVPHGIGIKV